LKFEEAARLLKDCCAKVIEARSRDYRLEPQAAVVRRHPERRAARLVNGELSEKERLEMSDIRP